MRFGKIGRNKTEFTTANSGKKGDKVTLLGGGKKKKKTKGGADIKEN